MTQFLQVYGIWIVLGLVLVFLLYRFARSGGHYFQSGHTPDGLRQQTGNRKTGERENSGDHRHGCC